MIIATILFLIVLSLLILFQVALICGVPLGHFAWGGQDKVLPAKKRIGSVASIVVYLIMAAFVLSKAQVLPIVTNETVLNIGLWVIFGYLVLGIVLNALSHSVPERAVMTPVAAILAVCVGIVAWSPAPSQTINSFDACKDAGGALLQSYPEQCLIYGQTYVNTAQLNSGSEYVGLSEQAALDKAEAEDKQARVVERDGEPLEITADFVFGRLNLHIKDGVVYKVEIEGLAQDN